MYPCAEGEVGVKNFISRYFNFVISFHYKTQESYRYALYTVCNIDHSYLRSINPSSIIEDTSDLNASQLFTSEIQYSRSLSTGNILGSEIQDSTRLPSFYATCG